MEKVRNNTDQKRNTRELTQIAKINIKTGRMTIFFAINDTNFSPPKDDYYF